MKHLTPILAAVLILSLLSGCSAQTERPDIAATTLPVFEFTSRLCQGTGLTVTRLITESVSCLHDYSLQTEQMRTIAGAKVVVLSGAGLEEFLEDALASANTVIDASEGIPLLEGEEGHDHDHDHDLHETGHSHEQDPHIWLSPANAKIMAENICEGLAEQFPDQADDFRRNLPGLLEELDALQQYGADTLSSLSCRELITFHDGFAYFAQAFDLTILEAVEEESGSEAPASKLIELIELTEEHHLPAIFTEANGSTSAAAIIGAETGAKIYMLDMAMAGDSYFEAMYHNIDTIREALG